jgi:hypothetical protein
MAVVTRFLAPTKPETTPSDPLPPPAPPALKQPREPRGGGGRLLAVFAVVVTLFAVGALRLPDWLPDLKNPFTTKTVDRTPPPVLKALEDLSQYRAATGHFEVIVDVEQDAKYLPTALKGQRTLFVATGTVDGIVDFSQLTDDAVVTFADRKTVGIRVPQATLGQVRVDPAGSYVFERKRGLLDRLGGVVADSPTGEQELYQLAEAKMLAAAEGDSGIRERAEENTRAMLTSLLKSLGFETINITFGPPGTT